MTTSPRSLRVGILIAGQLVEERTFDGATPITFGQSLRCDLSVPIDDIPREHVLAVREDGRWRLRPPAGASTSGDATRGRVTLGEVTVLVQEVATAPAMPLPASLRLSFADRIDRRLALVVGGSLVVHLGIAVTAWLEDIAEPSYGTPYIATTYHQDMIDVTVPDTLAPPVSTRGASTPVAPTAQTPRPIVTPSRITTRPTQQPVDSTKLASILTGGETPGGKGGMSPRQPGAELGKQIDAARDGNVKIGDGTQTSRTDDRVHVDANDRQVVDDPSLTRDTPPRRDESTVGRVIPGKVIPDDDTSLTPAAVLDRINTVYMAGLQRCYRLGLATDAELSGRVAIKFTVDDRGKVIDAEAGGMSTQVDGCIEKQMGGWRFAVPKDKAGTATDATFAVSLALQPS